MKYQKKEGLFDFLYTYYLISERIVESYNTSRPTLFDKIRISKDQLNWDFKKRADSLEEVEKYLSSYHQNPQGGGFRVADIKDKERLVLTFEAIPAWPNDLTGMWERYNAGELKRSYVQVKIEPRISLNKSVYQKSQTNKK